MSETNRPTILNTIAARLPTNGRGNITAADLRATLDQMTQSMALRVENLADVSDAAAARTNIGAAPTSHTHPISDIINLQSGLDTKANLSGASFTGAVQHISGTASLPGITFTGDTDTGMWRPGANLIAWSTNGAERLRITAAGSVGIGTDNPGGDGTFGQWARLDLVGNDGNIRISNTESDTTTKFGRLVLRHYNASERNSYLIGGVNSATDNVVNIGGSSTTLYQATDIRFFTAADTTTTGSSERMRIDSNGNVGIGTSAPNAAALLDVSSTTQGFLPPRMTGTQRDAISTPPNGLVLYNTTTNKLQVRAGGSWVDLH
jgi:hypothetical protein